MNLPTRWLASIRMNTGLWMGLWGLLMLNIIVILILVRGFSWWSLSIAMIIAAAGAAALTALARLPEPDPSIDDGMSIGLNALMEEIRPVCEQVFDQHITRLMAPLKTELNQEFSRGIEWLWEEVDAFYQEVEANAQEGRSVLQFINSLKEDKAKLIEQMQENVRQVLAVLQEVQERQKQDQEQVQSWVEEHCAEFRQSMEREKEFFYDYVYKMLVEQARFQGPETDIADYFNVTALGQQFAVVMDKSLETRMAAFQETLIQDLENFSADIVGRLQKMTAQILNHFREIMNLLSRLIDTSRSESGVLVRRLEEYHQRTRQLEERAGEILVTLAWQDILVEKRWHEIQENLFQVKDQVMEHVDESVWEYISRKLEQEIPGLSEMARDADTAVFYKSLLDSEVIYEVYSGNKLPLVIDAVHCLLQFIRPLELLASRTIRMTDQALHRVREWKPQIKKGAFQLQFDRVRAALDRDQPGAADYLEGAFPRQLYQFASNPYLKAKPDHTSQAAWAVFTLLIDNENLAEDLYLLVGLLLTVHQVRNRQIHPFKSIPVELTETSEVALMRSVCYRAISILLQTKTQGITRIGLPDRNH